MAYTAPGIDANGFHAPEYEDILQRLLARFREIFGDDLYLGPDTQDYQACAEFADLYDDIGAALAEVYASKNPDLATGLSLDYLLPLNGLRRLLATHSTAVVTASGTEGTTIPAGSLMMDANGNLWATDNDATIPAAGSVSINATAVEAGHINAEIGGISKIMSPTAGWISVTNAAAAVAGRNVETDAEAHERRSASVSNNGRGMMETIIGHLRQLPGVKKARVYENDAGSTDANGVPSHSLCAVVLGGENDAIAKAVFAKKSPGCGTYGNTTVTVQDIFENSYSIKFSRPSTARIYVQMTIKTFDGYTDETANIIKKNIQEYIDSIQIGTDLNVGMLWSCVLAVNSDITKPICTPVSAQAKNGSGSYQSTTVAVAYDAVMSCALADITITAQS